MSVYLPPTFASDDWAAIERLVREHPFATLVTPGGDEPHVTHLPLLLRSGAAPQSAPLVSADDPSHALPVGHSAGHLVGHVARANPHWRHFTDGLSTVIFHGPHAYISPSWYVEPSTQVPTWNYAVVHLHGTIALVDERSAKLAMVRSLAAHFESHRPDPWQLQLEGRRLEAMLDAIVGFHFSIARVDAKFKFSQNKSGDDRQRLIAGLRGEDHAESTATAAWMEKYAADR